MNCPRNSFGQPLCDIVAHPDRPNHESFCSACDRRFHSDSPFIHPWALFLALVMALLVMTALQESDRPSPSPQSQSMQGAALLPEAARRSSLRSSY